MEIKSEEPVNDTVSGSAARKNRTTIRMDGPDGGMAWIVALAACMINFIMAGLGRMSGILYVAFIDEFKVGRKEASTPFSLRSSIRNLLGPIVGILGQKYGVRAVTVTGGIVGSLSAASCFFLASDINWISVLWGGLNGMGSALTVVLPQVVIGQYFVKHRTTAAGMAFSGGCLGAFVFPLLLEHFILNSGIEGTFLVMAGIIMNTIPAAMILRKPPWLKNDSGHNPKPEVPVPHTVDRVVGRDEGNVVNSPTSTPKSSRGFRKGKQDGKNWPDLHYLRQHSNLIVKMLTLKSVGENTLSASLHVHHTQPVSAIEVCIMEELEDMFRCLQYSGEKARFYRNLRLGEDRLFRDMAQKNDLKSVHTRSFHTDTRFKYGFSGLFKTSSAPDISKISKEISNNYVLQKMRDLLAMDCVRVWTCFPEENKRKIFKIMKEVRKLYDSNADFGNPEPRDVPNADIPSESVGETRRNGFLDHLKTALKLHINPMFLLICLCRVVHFLAFLPVMTTVVDFVKDKGLQDYDGKYAIGALSVGDLLGRLCFGWVTDHGYMSLGKYMMVVMVLQGASTVSLPLMHSRVSIFATLAVFGMLEGSLFVRHPVLVSKHMKSHEQSIAMGCINFFSGILGFGLPVYIGYFRDTLGSYDYIFYINGVVGALVGLLWSLEPYFVRVVSGKRSKGKVPQTPV